MQYSMTIWTGPSIVDRVAKMTAFHAGTEHVYGTIEADSEDSARELFIARFRSAGFGPQSGFKVSEVRFNRGPYAVKVPA